MKRSTSPWWAGIRRLASRGRFAAVPAWPAGATPTLLAAPLELTGNWGETPTEAASPVLSRVRDACLAGVDLLSDRQPVRLRVEHRAVDYPSIWLHDEPATTAWVIVSIGPGDWCQLAYEFGHELGHVLCNSWDALARPSAPCQWLEESLAEAFAFRGLGRFAERCARDPPFENGSAFAAEIRQYRQFHLERCDARTPDEPIGAWFGAARSALDAKGGEAGAEAPATLAILAEMEKDAGCVADLGALNRWPARSSASLETYLVLWEKSCVEIGAPGLLPVRLRALLELGR